jgi:hypothetical protein
MLDRTMEKQMMLTRQIFQRRFHDERIRSFGLVFFKTFFVLFISAVHIPSERAALLRTKIYLLKNRLMKLICRGIVCNFVFAYIEQAFSDDLERYISKSTRQQRIDLNAIRSDLYELMRTLKAKAAEHNLLIDYRCYFRLIHTDTIEQLTQWKSQLSTSDSF